MSTPAFEIGSLRHLTVTFTTLAGAAADPDGVSVTVTPPDGVSVVRTLADGVVNEASAVGLFSYDYLIAQAGRHTVRWAGTGAVQAVAPYEFYARRKETV
jgi:hypothetical protein